jgi:hypothetical protein
MHHPCGVQRCRHRGRIGQRKGDDSMTEEERAALKKYQDVNINRRDAVQAVRQELAS